MRKAKTSLSAVAAAGALVAAGVAMAPTANAAPQRHALARTTPAWVAKADSLGKAPSQHQVNVQVFLAPKGGTDALKAAVASVSDPTSSNYRHFLSAGQYHARFDATSATVKDVSGFLADNHLKVTGVEQHHRYLSVRGSTANIAKAFGTTIKRFKHRGQIVQANTSALTVPADLASDIIAVAGVDTTPNPLKHFSHHDAPPAPGFRNARPCSRTYGSVVAKYKADFKTKLPRFGGTYLPYAVCGYTGPQLRSAYEGSQAGVLTGQGTTVAIIDAYASPTIVGDSNTYASQHGDGSYVRGQLTQVKDATKFNHQPLCGPAGWYGEETLDVEAVHAMAPAANIRYYASPSCLDNDFYNTQAKVIDQNKVSIVSNSYGEAEQYVDADTAAAETQLYMQAAMQGISFLFSSGDSGDELANTGIKQADATATDPYVTAVGGTADAINAAGTFDFQTGWGTEKYSLSSDGTSWSPLGYLYGAGGGISALFNKPSYQDGVVPDKFGVGRAVPDIAMDADPTTGMLVGQTQAFPDGNYYGEYRIGGTSLASPLMAGMAALATQHTGTRLGFLNPVIYSQAGTSVFRDIQGAPKDAGNVRVDYANGLDATDGLLYSIRTFDQNSSLVTVKGWDDTTGVGSPNSSWLTSLGK